MIMLGFTYYGDLLGISSFYRLGPKVAHSRLDRFYSISLNSLVQFNVEMFSDSIFIVGDDAIAGLKELMNLYSNLLGENLLLRGAVVAGRLSFGPRFTRENFEKRLPDDDKLARATGLERSYKGARLLVENTLVETLFSSCPDWMTHEGYLRTMDNHPENEDVLKRICSTPNNSNYEVLYYWKENMSYDEYSRKTKELKHISMMYNDQLRLHYTETINLIHRSEERHRMTEDKQENLMESDTVTRC
jgi:hypothetical protein